MANENKHTERFEELCAGYVLNALEPEERTEFKEMLASADEEEKEFYHKLRSAANNLAFNVNRVEPPAAVKERLMQVVNEDIEEQQSTGATSSDGYDKMKFAIAASFALLVVTLSLLFYTFNLNSQLNATNEQLAQREQTITELENEIERKNEMLAILEAREVDMVVMQGMEANPDGYGKVIWDSEQRQALLQVSNLPPVPSDKEYQLWIIKNNTPVSAGLFAVNDPNRDSFFKIEQMEPTDEQSTNAFAVTLEPKGGMPKPTGDMYLMGNMEN
ncbi:anti-sigma factor [Aliifodinibius sp. S!AR15-10]|uniref:anti-sigma factor n=1 Tax=Aliifodinibius sp. S!AR15-10 TaxID=2950437 RepID=UPI0028624B35|nr:anti-sigma factor [Aliifodinibius sp. S!AR15-10]MDR8392755.1 anti-sigma factor [Aliifodinibius sp. S!AR15-10]